MTQAMTVQNKKNIRKNRKGFTLIELIVVIAILAILAAIAIPAFTGSLNNAKEKADDASERVIISAVRLYYAENEAYPVNMAALIPQYIDSEVTWSDGEAATFTVTNDEVTTNKDKDET